MDEYQSASPHEVGLQISRGVYPEVPETNTVCATEETTGRGVRAIGRAEREPDRRGAHDDRSVHMIDVHMMIAIPPKYAVSQVVGYIKGKSAIPWRVFTGSENGTLSGSTSGRVGTSCPPWAATKP
jgi:hypothetical protein